MNRKTLANPCHGCTKRHPKCHETCNRHKIAQEIRRQDREKVKKAQQGERDFCEYLGNTHRIIMRNVYHKKVK